jgi:hypothetical protein
MKATVMAVEREKNQPTKMKDWRREESMTQGEDSS